ncbi:nonribosomal peptide synthase atnA [Colletotrichum liriopes]|uniref:Nonribosomal peptide synthase atnA n=1 Tax=Colletotrichum liriopes TaxID=708192 RepID=A0AA37GZT6_9PEZI|nr:nonribosomal peptide synthase atnA [Colletotrichum liriopes]
MLQFVSYVFDAVILKSIGTLIAGACVCVPSDHMRMNNLAEFLLTPSFLRTITRDDVPGLKVLIATGEAVGKDIVDGWHGLMRLFSDWGSAETCVFSTLHEFSPNDSSLTIGRPVGGMCWIVEPENPRCLAPIGCVGEVVIQGPTLLREYLGNEQLTEQSMARLDWFYKSGDLAFYNKADGTIEFVGRKDTQVKIRGLHVQLSEVEHHVRESFEGVHQVAVDVFKTEAATNLVVYFCFSNDTQAGGQLSGPDGPFIPITSSLERVIATMAGRLAVHLPQYMVPTLFIPCRYIPVITSTKLDGKRLRNAAAALGLRDLAMYSLSGGKHRRPETEAETRLQKLWADLLGLPLDMIGRNDSFLRIGGDSISAISLVSAGRNAGFAFSVKDIFDDPRLSSLSLMVRAGVGVDDAQGYDRVVAVENAPSFSLLAQPLRDVVKHQSSTDDGKVINGQPLGPSLREICGLPDGALTNYYLRTYYSLYLKKHNYSYL